MGRLAGARRASLPPVRSLQGKVVAFSGNATAGAGGQGEFLRQMIAALASLPVRGRVLSRGASAPQVECRDVPFQGWPQLAARLLGRLPRVRGRRDWLTLLSDLQFDAGAAERVGAVDLLDGVIGQCRTTFARLRPSARLVLTCLNTHLEHLARVLQEEHGRLGIRQPPFLHPRMLRRAREELELADRIRVNSQLARGTFVERGVPAERVEVVQPVLDHAHFRPVPGGEDRFRVLAVSTIEPRKGIHYLLEGFAQAAIPGAELVLIGATGDRWSRRLIDDYRGRIPLRVVALDVTRAPIADSYGAASVLVHPAIEDGYGLVVAQALACGRPVIASSDTGAAELIRDGEQGFVVPSRSASAIRDRLRLLAADQQLAARMRAAAPVAVAHLTQEAFNQAVGGLYERALG